MKTIPQVVFAGFDELTKQWEIIIVGEIPVDNVAPFEDGESKDPDPIVRIFMPLKRRYIKERRCCVAPYMPIRSEQGGQHTITIGFAVDFRVKNVNKIMGDFVKDFSEEIERYVQEHFFGDINEEEN